MIRAGSTLQYNLVRNLVEKCGAGISEGYFEESQFPDLKDQFESWRHQQDYHIIKTHDLFPNAPEIATTQSARICYIYRDIRDVAVSAKRKWNKEGEDLIKTLDKAISTYYKLKDIKGILWQKYEDVMQDIPEAIRTLADFLDLDPTEKIIKEITEECSLENIRKQQKNAKYYFAAIMKPILHRLRLIKHSLYRIGIPEDKLRWLKDPMFGYDKQTLFHADHISVTAGSVGVWETALDKDEIDAIMERYGSWLLETGYVK